ncbi:peptidylprolyl isomerase [Aeoliella sp. ICT_H6.2]|uniref:Peptidyl-prolyl cis-trans isomerase n=1 Tax=Aeoliella straminimaris TaxID=2954799 RepID=A0A9X2JHL6_9BACT|nr:peptidylprolyl isomerase [Aeoliella straminimaris]MCO6045582.1 peptidylprolyl isomerase [Aeoliella straminimaris]
MQIDSKSAVAIDYKLTDAQGTVIDSSEGREPLWYLHGFDNIVPGLERELSGKGVGDRLQVEVAPAEGYGERNEALKQQVSRDKFGGVDDLEEGMQFQAQTDAGPMVFTIVDVSEEVVTVDGNHPLAGMALHFDVTVRDIREATDEEISHGHIHGPGGHQH